MKSPKVSVIIPVYNSELYISNCINSLLNQTLYECEFIFVNDGSTDSSLEILKKHQYSDDRIIIIDQKNGGISRARNRGLDAAKGEYIGFSDNDDYLELNMLETLYSKAISSRADIIVSKTILGRDGKEIIKESIFPVEKVFDSNFIKKEIIPNLLAKEDLFAVWNKLYSYDLINQNNIKFPDDRNIEEDNMFNLGAFNKSNSVIFIDYAGYHFRELERSESRRILDKDYFKYALERYYFDYKSHFGLDISDSEFEKLKAFRFINRIIYLTFASTIDKGSTFKHKYQYISKMILREDVKLIVEKNYEYIKKSSGLFESWVLNIIRNQSKMQLYFLVRLVKIGYSPKISELLRFVNKKVIG